MPRLWQRKMNSPRGVVDGRMRLDFYKGELRSYGLRNWMYFRYEITPDKKTIRCIRKPAPPLKNGIRPKAEPYHGYITPDVRKGHSYLELQGLRVVSFRSRDVPLHFDGDDFEIRLKRPLELVSTNGLCPLPDPEMEDVVRAHFAAIADSPLPKPRDVDPAMIAVDVICEQYWHLMQDGIEDHQLRVERIKRDIKTYERLLAPL